MPRRKPLPLSAHIERFNKYKKPQQIMFCKRYKVEDIWDIHIGAILDLSKHPHIHLVCICQNLYMENPDWFIGDITALMEYRISE